MLELKYASWCFCVCVCVCGEHNQNCHCPEDSGLILPLSCVVMSSRYATWPLWFWASSPAQSLSHACLTGSPPSSSSSTPCLPCQLGSRSQLPSFLALLASVNIQRCRWVWYGHKKPSTVDCAPWFAPTTSGTSEGRRRKKNEQRGKVAACKSGDENRRTQTRRAQKWHSVSTVPEDLRSQSTFIAVAGLDCVEKLTEQWVQLWPRSAWLASQPISRPDVRHSDYFIYILLVFHFYFLPPSSLPGAGSLKGKEKER